MPEKWILIGVFCFILALVFGGIHSDYQKAQIELAKIQQEKCK